MQIERRAVLRGWVGVSRVAWEAPLFALAMASLLAAALAQYLDAAIPYSENFNGNDDGVAYFEALLRDGPVNQTRLAWYRSTCVGVATLGVGPTGILDLGVLVEDAWQRRGIGSRLIAS